MISPWVNFYREIEALFGRDPEIRIEWDEPFGLRSETEIVLYVENTEKTDALTKLLPAEKVLGNITITLTVKPANGNQSGKARLFEQAFKGNPVFSRAESVSDISSNDFDFIVFKPEIVQYWNDNLGDINGYRSTLYEDIARDVFEVPGCYYNTELLEPELKPFEPGEGD